MSINDERLEYDSEGSTGSASLLSHVFGTRGKAEILAVLITKSTRELSVSEIANLAGLNRSHTYEPLEDLVDIGLVLKTRKVGNSQLYQINRESDSATLIAELQFSLADEFAERIHELEKSAT